MFKTELHCHTRDASPCSNMSAEATVERYLEYGYSTLVITNHLYGRIDLNDRDEWMNYIDMHYSAYDNLVTASAGRLNVLFGIEARFVQNGNDYLVFGGFDRKLLEDLGPDTIKMGVRDFTDIIHGNGGIVVHAHPFRYNTVISVEGWIDGIEVFNGHFKHDSHNDIAELWAERYGKIKTSGTDHHDDDHFPDGGILTETPVTSIEQLVETLKSGKYELYRDYSRGKPQYDMYGQFLGLK